MVMATAGAVGIAGAIGVGWLWFTPAGVPDRLEYLPKGVVAPSAQVAQARAPQAQDGSTQFDFSNETVGAEPKSFLSVVGFWTIGAEGDNKFLVVDGRRWKQGQPAANLADKARARSFPFSTSLPGSRRRRRAPPTRTNSTIRSLQMPRMPRCGSTGCSRSPLQWCGGSQ